ncbi:MBL fold metallo-hydrolase [Acaricomes phytoseiuli]|uniref:MBL fold metallo-hydrolase n=1 Tax=Acaricomes phytoseiuli TaxID=291968 RepID=UPI00037675E5|nr:MBL fold metallo-hydrolase [Acaricomes phytoseiuli]MCW1248922.1 MBL fold metallo-hydrolase [Acaricomes phytoseiuli]
MSIERIRTEGTFSLDGGSWEVENNTWIIGDGAAGAEVILIDPAHDAAAIAHTVAGRRVKAVLLSHGHDDHIGAALEFSELTGAPLYLHPADTMLWERVYPGRPAPEPLAEGQRFHLRTADEAHDAAGLFLTVLHTPGHSPGSCCFYAPALRTVFTGDTLFQGGPGATGRSFSDFPTIIESITTKLLTLPPETEVLPGHGEASSIDAEAPQRQEWIDRGH